MKAKIPFLPNIKSRIRLMFQKQPERIKLGNRYVGVGEPVFVIAEIGINHNGDMAVAKKLIDKAREANVDAVKFQMRDLESLYVNKGNASDIRENLSSQYTLDILNRFHLSPEQMIELFDYAHDAGVFPLCTPWDKKTLERLEDYGMDVYKIASADLTNHELISSVVATGKPVICSTGMADEHEIAEANALLRRLGAKYILLHCNSTYPAPFRDINLQYMARLGTAVYGYSGHERGVNIAVAAVARGAKVIEKHITLDRNMEGSDHQASLLPEEFAQMVEAIRQVEEALGSSGKRAMTQGERMNRSNLAKSLIINRDLKKGQVIREDMLETKSPGRGLQPNRKKDLIGRTVRRDMKQGDFFFPTDLLDTHVSPRNYTFRHPWGLPVRYHDFKAIIKGTNPNLLEFHLSFKDMEEDPKKFFDQTYDFDLVIHSPETFANDHILDLSSPDDVYWERSIKELQKVVDLTRKLKAYFPNAKRPPIVVNVGGFTKDKALSPEERVPRYQRVAEALSRIDAEGVEIIPQTMPPYPWLMGGQYFHNLFVDPVDTAAFCETYGYRLCLDVSHSKLACTNFSWSFADFVSAIGPFVKHLHLVDAAGVGEEGLQIGEGEIDFALLAKQLQTLAPQASFIPEIWQGHENGGEGFWVALERLEKYF